MCGILGYYSNNEITIDIFNRLKNGMTHIKNRGPDYTVVKELENCVLGFHRLSIVGTDEQTNCLLHNREETVWMTCNGEIYNYEFLYEKYKFTKMTSSDCEIIIHLYEYYTEKGYDLVDMINELDGVFAFMLYDKKKDIVFVARDKIGIRPLYYLTMDGSLIVGSEGKGLVPIYEYYANLYSDFTKIRQVPPGSYILLKNNQLTYVNKWDVYSNNGLIKIHGTEKHHKKMIHDLLEHAVIKRFQSNRPLGFLLSGGLDSSLIASIASHHMKEITTFSIGLEGSPDLYHARKVAEYINNVETGQDVPNHHEIIITEKDIELALPEVIKCLETTDITTIRASIPMYLLSKYISEKTNIKVIFSGEGADELFGGYLYFHSAPSLYEFQIETHRLVNELHKYDVLRSDRTTAHWGLELRVPFLDKTFVEYVLHMDPYWKAPSTFEMEKYILRESFNEYLPANVLYRQKEAFSDGVGYSSVALLKRLGLERYGSEENMYNSIYNTFGYGCIENTTTHWMPKWNDGVTDPSATCLSVHKIKNK